MASAALLVAGCGTSSDDDELERTARWHRVRGAGHPDGDVGR